MKFKKLLLASLVFATLPLAARESEEFVQKIVRAHRLNAAQEKNLRSAILSSGSLTRNIGSEDPSLVAGTNNSYHMASRQACVEKVLKTGLVKANAEYERICGAAWMAPVPGVGQSPQSAKVCIDQFEFPDIPCEYPVVWSTAALANRVCSSMGKRVCNSQEWEGACAGGMDPIKEYHFEIADRSARRNFINKNRPMVWAYQSQPGPGGVTDSREVCGVYSPNDPEIGMPMRANPGKYFSAIGKSLTCQNVGSSDYQTCGTNTWPSGFKNRCRSRYDVYDLHGNVAEVMNLPENGGEIAGQGWHLGGTERKGSFFVYRSGYPDDCHVRQPYEHYGPFATDGMSYYQEGFRCCKDVP